MSLEECTMAPGGSKRVAKLRMWPKLRTAVAVALVQAADHLDEALLGSLYLPLSRTLGVTPTGLGGLSMARSLVKVRLGALLGTQKGLALGVQAGALAGGTGRGPVWGAHSRWCPLEHAPFASWLTRRAASRAQSLFSPVAGVMGDRLNRMHVIVFGTLCWAVFTLLFGFAKHYAEVACPPARPCPLAILPTRPCTVLSMTAPRQPARRVCPPLLSRA